MLVLSRHRNEVIDIAGGAAVGGVSITIVDIRGDKVRIGVEASRDVTVHRREVQEAINRSAPAAGSSAPATPASGLDRS